MIRKETKVYFALTNGKEKVKTFRTKKDATAFIRDLQKLDEVSRWSYEPFE